jgi:DNA-binding NarL/FixJ family response regulator
MPARLLVVDDNEIVRTGVRIFLYNRPEWEICGEAENGADALAKVRELRPNVVILDLNMPVMNGYQTADRIREIAPSTKIIFFSIHDTPPTAGWRGADAFVSKSYAARDLARTVNRLLEA